MVKPLKPWPPPPDYKKIWMRFPQEIEVIDGYIELPYISSAVEQTERGPSYVPMTAKVKVKQGNEPSS